MMKATLVQFLLSSMTPLSQSNSTDLFAHLKDLLKFIPLNFKCKEIFMNCQMTPYFISSCHTHGGSTESRQFFLTSPQVPALFLHHEDVR